MTEEVEAFEGILRGKRRKLRKLQRVDPKIVRASALGEQLENKKGKGGRRIDLKAVWIN